MPFGPGLQPGEPPLLNLPSVTVPGRDLRTRGGPGAGLVRAGADDGTRTRNLRFTKPLLYQLSYVGATGRAIPQMDLSAPGNDRAGRHHGSSVADAGDALAQGGSLGQQVVVAVVVGRRGRGGAVAFGGSASRAFGVVAATALAFAAAAALGFGRRPRPSPRRRLRLGVAFGVAVALGVARPPRPWLRSWPSLRLRGFDGRGLRCRVGRPSPCGGLRRRRGLGRCLGRLRGGCLAFGRALPSCGASCAAFDSVAGFDFGACLGRSAGLGLRRRRGRRPRARRLGDRRRRARLELGRRSASTARAARSERRSDRPSRRDRAGRRPRTAGPTRRRPR